MCLVMIFLGTQFSYAQTELKHYEPKPVKPIEKKVLPKARVMPKVKVVEKAEAPRSESRSDSTKKTMVYLERSDVLMFDEANYPDAQLLVGNVILRHDSAYLFCDTAYFYQSKNSFSAFGNVRMEQGDTLSAYSDRLYYYGDNKMAELRDNVRLINDGVELITDSLNYNRSNNVGYYFEGGKLIDSLNTLVSERGYYYSDTKLAEFRKKVELINEDFVINSDTLKYNTDTKIASILGPTTILYQEETTIYSELGFYNTDNEKSYLKKNSWVAQPGGKVLKGDTIYYDKKQGIGRAFHNVELNDSSNNISLLGHYGFYLEDGERGLVTDSAVMMEFSSKDTLYVNADTLYSYAQDTNKVVIAYNNVRIYRHDLQAVCDSMSFYSVDTILNMMDIPVLWSDGSQMTGDTIKLFIKGEDIDKIHVVNNAFISQQEDTVHYNQISGKDIYCYIQDSALRKVEVIGNAESLYFPKDSTVFIGMNLLQSTYMNVHFKEGKIDRLVVYPTPTAKMLQMSKLTKEQKYLTNFTWLEYLQPKTKEDIFLRPQTSKVLEDRESNKDNIKQLEREQREKERQERKRGNKEKKTKTEQ